jgi:hypothetical protein
VHVNLSEFQQAKKFAFRDIQREIALAYATENPATQLLLNQAGVESGGGNFLAALGLLCYTEFGGNLKYNRRAASANFNNFFDDLGPAYKAFRVRHNVYDIFRCGLAHEYYVKQSCTIAMMDRGASCGIYINSSQRYWFVVERYYHDLRRAFDELERYLFPNP